jgi:hypothetical protein
MVMPTKSRSLSFLVCCAYNRYYDSISLFWNLELPGAKVLWFCLFGVLMCLKKPIYPVTFQQRQGVRPKRSERAFLIHTPKITSYVKRFIGGEAYNTW